MNYPFLLVCLEDACRRACGEWARGDGVII